MAVIGNFNRQSPTLLGSEWRPQTGRNIVLSSTTRAVAQRIVPSNITARDVDVYLSQIVGTPGIGIEIVSTLEPTLDTPIDRFPGTDTGATKSDWLNESDAAASYTKVAKKVASTTYLKPNTSKATSLEFRAASAISAGKRIVSITQGMLARWPGSVDGGVSGFHYSPASGTAYPALKGVVNISGTDYQTGLNPGGIVSKFTTFTSPPMWLNPSTGLPWTLTQANSLANGTDEFGVTRNASIYTLEAQIAGLWLTIQTCAENRVACYSSTTAQTLGWQRYTLTGPDGGAVSAFSANTYYWLVIYLLSTTGGASLSLPALKDTNLIVSTSASGTGEHRQTYNVTLDRGVVIDSTDVVPGEIAALMVETSGSAWIGDSSPYVTLAPLEVSTGPSQQLTAPSGTTFGGVRLNVGWESTNLRSGTLPPDAPLLIEVRSGVGASTGGGSLVATATIGPDQFTTGALQDIQVPFDASFVSTATQYSIYFKSAATTDRSWVVGQLDTGSATVTTISTANVEATGIGGTTDSYQDTAGSATSRYDIPVLLIPAVSAPGSLAVTALAAA